MAEHLAAGLDHAPVGERHGLDAAAGAVARLEHDHVRAGALRSRAAVRPASPAPRTATSINSRLA